jgi:hypothetical protein
MTDDQQHALQEQRHREALAVEMAGLRADAERLTWLINESNAGGGWLDDGVWDRASNFYDEDEDPQQGVRAAIDAAMKEGK